MVCTFFGHKDTPKEIEPTLRSTLIDLIENKNVNVFYVGKLYWSREHSAL